MTEHDATTPLDSILRALQERAKELNCLYHVDDILQTPSVALEDVFQRLVEAIPAGWQYSAACRARITYRGLVVRAEGFEETPWMQTAPIVVQGDPAGSLTVCYLRALPAAEEGPFLRDERKLIESIAERLAAFLLHRELSAVFGRPRAEEPREDWRIILDLLVRTDLNLFRRIARKMLNHLSVAGIPEAKALLHRGVEVQTDENKPLNLSELQDIESVADETFAIAAARLDQGEILSLIQVWIKEDRVNFLLLALESSYTTLVEIANVIERYHHTGISSRELSPATQVVIKNALVRRLLTDSPDFINRARRFLEVEDFIPLVGRTVVLPKSHGRLGGKGAGIFLAGRVIQRAEGSGDMLRDIKTPRTWHLPSDGVLQFVAFNNLDDVYNWRYRDIDQIRQEYPHILEVFKSSRFPPEIVNGLSATLDDFGEKPIVVRSSSLLEDRVGSAFSGKYKSLFLSNQGDRNTRLAALLDAVAEVYASVFGPDAIQYRAERGLLEHHEEMGILMQEVVGAKVGKYYLPAFAGVGLTQNELRWSPRIRRDDGLLRLVPGLGTRAVDRLSDDYPLLVAPGQPGLRVNVSPEEAVRYSPSHIDVINLEAGGFETVSTRKLLRETGGRFPMLEQLVSVLEQDHLRRPTAMDLGRDDLVFTFEGLFQNTAFLTRMRALLTLLSDSLGFPVDIEFACDGRDLYLLQCRPQTHSLDSAPAAIPHDLPSAQVLFTAHRYVTNGRVPDLTHVVYVDGEGYGRIGDFDELRAVGRCVGKLNKLLPKRRFALIGPGRWGSRGDIRLGVSVTYSDINNSPLLVEVARKKGSYVPDLSFGTHFFQDLVEASIRYLPLYPDDPGVQFNEAFLRGAPSVLEDLLPEFARLRDVVRVIDVPAATGGHVLRVLMNADADEAIGMFASPGTLPVVNYRPEPQPVRKADEPSRWRLRAAQGMAAHADPGELGVKAFYLVGSAKNGTADSDSDIDLIVHFSGTPEQRVRLEAWLEGWNGCLVEMNYLRTTRRSPRLLHARVVTDEEVAARTGIAAKIGAVTDPARELPLGQMPA